MAILPQQQTGPGNPVVLDSTGKLPVLDGSQLTNISAAQVGADPAGSATSAVSAHVALADPHAQYQKESEKDAANGYAGLSAALKIAASQIQEVIALADLTDVTAKTGTGTIAVMQDSPTITTPTIASFVNSNHNHQNAAGGGTLDAAAIAAGTMSRARLPLQLAYEDEANTFTQTNDFTGTVRTPRKTTPGSPVTGEIYVDGADLKYRDNQGSPANQTVERLSNKAVASGYPSLNGSTRVVQDPANATATPTAGKIPYADANGRLDGWITGDHAPQHNFLTTNETTTSTAFTPLFSFTRTTEGPNTKLVILAAFGFSNSANDRVVSFQLRVNGTPVRATGLRVRGSGAPANAGLVYKTGALAAGNQTIEIWWKTSASTAQVRPLSAPDAAEFLDVLTWETN